MNAWLNLQTLVAFIAGVLLSAMIKAWVARARSAVA